MKKITNITILVVISFVIIFLAYLGSPIKELVFSEQNVQKIEPTTVSITDTKDWQVKKQKILDELGKVWEDLRKTNEYKELVSVGYTQNEIAVKLTPLANEQVMKNLGVTNAEIAKAVNESIAEAKAKEAETKSKSQSR